eukprot:11456884-Prorocentrum_lima.AAC.1
MRSRKSSRWGTTVQRFRRASASRAKTMFTKAGWLCWKVATEPHNAGCVQSPAICQAWAHA